MTDRSRLAPQQMRSGDLLLHRASPTDSVRIAALVNSAYRGESSRAGWTTEADFLDGQRTDPAAIEEILNQSNQCILIAEDHGNLIGCAHLEKTSDSVC